MTAAVPTVWLMLLQDLEKTGKMLPHLKRVLIGGSACPPSMIEIFEKKYDVDVVHAWGMTEMSPLGTLGSLKTHAGAPAVRRTPRLQDQTGPCAVRRRDEDHGRRRPRAAA